MGDDGGGGQSGSPGRGGVGRSPSPGKRGGGGGGGGSGPGGPGGPGGTPPPVVRQGLWFSNPPQNTRLYPSEFEAAFTFAPPRFAGFLAASGSAAEEPSPAGLLSPASGSGAAALGPRVELALFTQISDNLFTWAGAPATRLQGQSYSGGQVRDQINEWLRVYPNCMEDFGEFWKAPCDWKPPPPPPSLQRQRQPRAGVTQQDQGSGSVSGQESQRKGPVCAPSKAQQKAIKGPCGMIPATFYVDFFGNVISPAAVMGTLTYANVDHVFPYSRGGLSRRLLAAEACKQAPELCDSNFMLLQHASNRLKGECLQQEFVSLLPDSPNPENFRDAAAMQCGMTRKQLARLWEARSLLQIPGGGSAGGTAEHRDASYKELLDIMLCRPWAYFHPTRAPHSDPLYQLLSQTRTSASFAKDFIQIFLSATLDITRGLLQCWAVARSGEPTFIPAAYLSLLPAEAVTQSWTARGIIASRGGAAVNPNPDAPDEDDVMGPDVEADTEGNGGEGEDTGDMDTGEGTFFSGDGEISAAFEGQDGWEYQRGNEDALAQRDEVIAQLRDQLQSLQLKLHNAHSQPALYTSIPGGLDVQHQHSEPPSTPPRNRQQDWTAGPPQQQQPAPGLGQAQYGRWQASPHAHARGADHLAAGIIARVGMHYVFHPLQ
ncbi:MAG: hypothetical protein WDW38_002645 [Sanguina aurantia]